MVEEPITDSEVVDPKATPMLAALDKEEASRNQVMVRPAGGEITVPVEASPYAGAGTLQLSETQAAVLMGELPKDAHDILPTGEIYVSQIHYRRLLSKVFGPGGWALVPMTDPRANQKKGAGDKPIGPITIIQKYHLVAQGRFIAEAWGEQNYYESNDGMSYASALEGAKSNALSRCCKDLGIASECWDKRWTDEFRAKECVKVSAPNRTGEFKPVWRLKIARPFPGERPFNG